MLDKRTDGGHGSGNMQNDQGMEGFSEARLPHLVILRLKYHFN